MEAAGRLGLVLALFLCCGALGSPEGNRELELYRRLFANYDKTRWPTQSGDEAVQVSLKLTLTHIISLSTKEEILTTNLWMTQEWNDYRLNFSMEEYNNSLRVPAEEVWRPDIVLENNIDGNFDAAYYVNVLISPGGDVSWTLPAIFRSSCPIEVTFFPFDWQNCSLVFRSKTHNARELELQFTSDAVGTVVIDPESFNVNKEWDIRYRPARKVLAAEGGVEAPGFSQIHYLLIVQRQPLFYVVNIIVPCVLISSLVVLVYFLPAEAGGQKCMVSISVLLAQTVFLFLIAQKVPRTSLAVPLIGKYLLFVMGVTALIVMNCVLVLNVSLRRSSTHTQPQNLKHLLLEVLPRFLGSSIEPAAAGESPDAPRPRRRSSFLLMVKAEEALLKTPRSEILFEHQRQRHGLCRAPDYGRLEGGKTDLLYKGLASLAPEVKECVDACNFMAKSAEEQSTSGAENENWVLMGKILDRLCFWFFFLLYAIGTLVIFSMGQLNTVPEDPFAGQEQP